jgi:hypothetical protein
MSSLGKSTSFCHRLYSFSHPYAVNYCVVVLVPKKGKLKKDINQQLRRRRSRKRFLYRSHLLCLVLWVSFMSWSHLQHSPTILITNSLHSAQESELGSTKSCPFLAVKHMTFPQHTLRLLLYHHNRL